MLEPGAVRGAWERRAAALLQGGGESCLPATAHGFREFHPGVGKGRRRKWLQRVAMAVWQSADRRVLVGLGQVGQRPQQWTGKLMRSSDSGRSWGEPESLPHGYVGPAKNKCLFTADGTLLAPASMEVCAITVS